MEKQKELCKTCLMFDNPCIIHPDLKEPVDECNFYIRYEPEDKKISQETINKYLGYN